MNRLALAVGGPTMAVLSALQPQRWGGGREELVGPAEQGGRGRGSILFTEKQVIFWLTSNPTCTWWPVTLSRC